MTKNKEDEYILISLILVTANLKCKIINQI